MDILTDLKVGDWVLVQPMGLDIGCPKCHRHFGCFGLREAKWKRIAEFPEAERAARCTVCGADFKLGEGRIRLDTGANIPYTWIQEIRREQHNV